jgi:hypothetical protein
LHFEGLDPRAREGEGWEKSLSEERLKMHTTVAEWKDVGGGEEIMNFESKEMDRGSEVRCTAGRKAPTRRGRRIQRV